MWQLWQSCWGTKLQIFPLTTFWYCVWIFAAILEQRKLWLYVAASAYSRGCLLISVCILPGFKAIPKVLPKKSWYFALFSQVIASAATPKCCSDAEVICNRCAKHCLWYLTLHDDMLHILMSNFANDESWKSFKCAKHIALIKMCLHFVPKSSITSSCCVCLVALPWADKNG